MSDVLNNGDGPGNPGDGAALYSASHPLNITEGMIAAGLKATEAEWKPGGNWRDWHDIVVAVYTAMSNAAPSHPDFEISDDAVEQVEIEVELSPEKVEELAIRAALGNNGGAWASHYTEAQKEHWRQWVRDMADMALAAKFEMRVVR